MNLVRKSFAKMQSSSMYSALVYVGVRWKTFVLVLVPLVFIPVAMMEGKAAKCGYVLCVMGVYWMTEVLPLPVTSLIPIVAFPLFGILSTNDVCMLYFKETNVMFMGGIIIAIAVEHCNLHRRIALRVLMMVGTSPRRLMFGFMLTTMFLSMWISNSAASAMMVPILSAILAELHNIHKAYEVPEDSKKPSADTFQPPPEVRIQEPPKEPEEGEPNPDTETPKPAESASSPDTAERKLSERRSHPGSDIRKPSDRSRIDTVFSTQIEKATVSGIEVQRGISRPTPEHVCYFLSIAYAANIGGTGTITGTTTNLVFKGLVESIFKDAEGVNYATWMEFNIPFMLFNTFLAWIWLQIVYMGWWKKREMKLTKEQKAQISQLIQRNYKEMGPITYHECSVLALFLLDVALWFFRWPEFMPGWSGLFPEQPVKDATAAIAVVILLFVLPANQNYLNCDMRLPMRSPSLLNWRVLEEKLPVGIILLLGSGYSISKACEVSGLSDLMGDSMQAVAKFPMFLTLAVILFSTTFATEFCSNTAIANIMLPVLARMSRVIRVHPLYLMMPTTISCSFAFMLPVATPPNAIVVAASNMPAIEMIKTGFGMNIICVLSLLVCFTYIGVPIYNLDHFPKWAELKTNVTV